MPAPTGRTRWEITATPAERAAITHAAYHAGLPIGATMAQLAEGARPNQRADWRIGIDALMRCAGLLEEIADAVAAAEDESAGADLAASLDRIETEIALIARPWLRREKDAS